MAGETMNPVECGLKEQSTPRYIDVNRETDAMEKVLETKRKEGIDENDATFFAFARFIDALKSTPTADVQEVKHGKWEQQTEPLGWEDVDCAVCSVCGESYILNEDMNIDDWKEWSRYCPNCGARMDEK